MCNYNYLKIARSYAFTLVIQSNKRHFENSRIINLVRDEL